MLDSGFKIDFSFITLIWRVIKRFWYMLLGGMILGIIVSVIAYYCVTPLYKSQLRFFTWNQTVSDAAREIGKSIDKEGSKAQSVIMYNNLVSQSMVIGQSLVEDYKLLLANPSVTDKVREKLGDQAVYKINISAQRQSCIIVIEAVSPSATTAQLAANTTMEMFLQEQLRLMGVRFAAQIQQAPLPVKPFFPQLKYFLLVGFFSGIMLGALMVFILDYFDLSLKTPEDVESLGILFLGEISQNRNMPEMLDLSNSDADKHQSRMLNDELTNIKTNLRHRNIENPQRSIVISSDAPGVGKSSFCIMLSQLLADEDNRVLLIDCDLRKPSLMEKLKLAPTKGLVQCLLDMNDELDLDNFIVPTKFAQVDFMSNGECPRRPTDFFSSKKFPELLHILSRKYRYVILDAPPAVQMSDAFLIASSADSVIFLGRHGVSRSDVYRRLLKTWEPLSGKILGAVLTFVNHRHGSYYYYYGGEHEKRGQ